MLNKESYPSVRKGYSLSTRRKLLAVEGVEREKEEKKKIDERNSQ